MRYLIIGLGIYGANLAVDLTKMGHEVIGADISAPLVESIKDYVSTAYILDATDKSALSALPLNNVDLVIVAIGENFGASIRTVALLKEMGVKHIFARAIDKLHESILEAFKIDRIITPEQRAAADLTREISLGADITTMRIDASHCVYRFVIPEVLVGLKYGSIPAFNSGSMRLIAVSRGKESTNILGINRRKYTVIPQSEIADTKAESFDIIAVIGTDEGFRDLISSL